MRQDDRRDSSGTRNPEINAAIIDHEETRKEIGDGDDEDGIELTEVSDCS